MLDIRYSTKFKKDFKTCVKRHYKMDLLQQVIDTLRIPETLPLKNKDHNLSGNYIGYRECHLEPDWLLFIAMKITNFYSIVQVLILIYLVCDFLFIIKSTNNLIIIKRKLPNKTTSA